MIYFDNAATTKPCKAAVNAVEKGLCEFFANPASRHAEGVKAAGELKKARQSAANALHTEPQNIIFTNSGTQADNIAVLGGAKKGVGRHVVTTAIEHPAVLNCFKALEEKGFDVTYIKPDKSGRITEDMIRLSLREDTSLVSVMAINNETGAVMPIESIKRHMSAICPRALLHTDAVQAFGKKELFPEKWGIDLLGVSGHKIHAPKGVGVLYIRQGVTLAQVMYGGGQERGIYSGTHDLPAIMGFGAACGEISYDNKNVSEINTFMRGEIAKMDGAVINSPDGASEYVLNVSFGNIPSEVILNALSDKGICVSSGSACSANMSGESHVLKAAGQNYKSAVRFSFSRYNTLEEAKFTVGVLNEVIPVLNFAVRGKK